MAWDFCADQDFQPTLDWITRFIAEEVQPLEPLLPQLSPQRAARLLEPLKEQVRDRELWAVHLPKELGGNGFGQLLDAARHIVSAVGLKRRQIGTWRIV